MGAAFAVKPSNPVIPPLSLVKLTSSAPEWRDQKGTTFRIGYYSHQDGLDCVWLVDDSGDYCQSTDQKSIGEDFTVLHLSDEDDFLGINRPIIGVRQHGP